MHPYINTSSVILIFKYNIQATQTHTVLLKNLMKFHQKNGQEKKL